MSEEEELLEVDLTDELGGEEQKTEEEQKETIAEKSANHGQPGQS